MRIAIANFQLAGDADEGPIGLTHDGRLVVDEQEFLRATAVELFNRANRATVISFSRVWSFTDLGAAELFLLDHPASIPQQETCKFTTMSNAGALSYRYIARAMVGAYRGAVMGTAITFNYTIRGGALQANEP